jgi:CO/xanthine dehydrogenase Mo-binding subunit
MGTFCSRGTYVNGNAIKLACREAIQKMLEAASAVNGNAIKLAIQKMLGRHGAARGRAGHGERQNF